MCLLRSPRSRVIDYFGDNIGLLCGNCKSCMRRTFSLRSSITLSRTFPKMQFQFLYIYQSYTKTSWSF